MEQTMCDIHMHGIPGVDDGSANMEMSLILLLEAHGQGIREIFTTPHSSAFDDPKRNIPALFRSLQSLAARHFPDMTLYPGCEVFCDPFSMEETLDALSSGKYPTLNGTNYVLAEFSPWGTAECAGQCLESLCQAGWIPVIAHLERYSYLQGRWAWVEWFREKGCLVQINAYSLAEETDSRIRSWARELVRRQYADFLGTDAHRTGHRPPRAAAGMAWITENCPETYTRKLLRENAENLLIHKEGSQWMP